MIPETISFTGLVLAGPDIIAKTDPERALIPVDWDRLYVRLSEGWEFRLPDGMVKWMDENMVFGWSAASVEPDKSSFVIRFEDTADAVMFRLMGGETAWNNA